MAERTARPSLRALAEAVSEAADHGLTLWAGGRTQVKRWEKTAGELVSEADLEVNQILHERLRALDPDAGWLSEETADSAHRLECERIWVVDPIDGTRDYLRGRPGWAVSVALIDRGVPVLGVLAAPARNELWLARFGHGATRNGHVLKAGDRTALTGARVPADTLPKTDRDLTPVPRPNSIALRMAMVAADQVDLCATIRWGNEWDIAAAALIAHEAGAVVTDALGRPLRFNRPRATAFGILCAAPGIHEKAIERLSERAHAALGQNPQS